MPAGRIKPLSSDEHLPSRIFRVLVAVAVVALLGFKYQLLYLQNINWDEFLFASRVFSYERGELDRPLQTIYVHLFGWIRSVPGNGIDRIIAARESMFVLRLGSCVLIYLIGRRLFGKTGAWLAVLASLAFSFVLSHGEAFRADPIISLAFLAAAALLIHRPDSPYASAAAGAILGLSVLISVKTVLYGPAVVALFAAAWLSTRDQRQLVANLAAFCLVGLMVCAVLFVVHQATLADAQPGATIGKLLDTGERMWAGPPARFVEMTFDWDRAWWLLVGLGATAAVFNLLTGSPGAKVTAVVVLALLLPLFTLTFYRNSFPYYYVCLIPPASLAIGYLGAIVKARLASRPAMAGLVLLALFIPTVLKTTDFLAANRFDAIEPQRRLLQAVHEVFPQPVPYIDRCSMVVEYPKVGLFMSTLVTGAYREAGEPLMQELVKERQPVFLLANSPGLRIEHPVEQVRRSPYRLLEVDHQYLRAHYVHHWGPIWVAGRQFELDDGIAQTFEMPVNGPYTLESTGDVELDGQAPGSGGVVTLESGTHLIRARGAPVSVTLRFGDHLPVPEGEPPRRALFTGLGFQTRL